MESNPNVDASKKKGPRIIGTIIIVLIFLFIAIEFFIREAQQFSAPSITNILLTTLQIILFLLGLILLFVLARNLLKLYLERRRKVVGSHFKTKLVLFFIALSFIPSLLLFVFASDLVSRNIEQWFRTPIDKILEDTRSLADGFYLNSAEITMHYAQQLSKAIEKQNLLDLERRLPLMEFVNKKLTEYKLDEIGIYLNNEELFSYLNPNLPLQYYQDLPKNRIQRAHLGELLRTIEPMGNGEMIRRGVSITIPEKGNLLVVAGKFLSQNYAQKITNITGYVKRYSQLKTERNDVKTFYSLTLIFLTMLIIFAATWIGFHLAKGITGPIEKLAQATKEVSSGNLDVRVEDPAPDELGTLIESFNQMIADLKGGQKNIAQKTAELEARKQYIETVLNNVATGVITLDAGGKITTINPSARQMLFLTESDLVGKDYTEVFKGNVYTKVVKYIETGLNNKFPLANKEININSEHQSKTLALTLSLLAQNGGSFSGLILVFDDLTQLIKAQKIAAWKEVAQRVAHEIKNPLTPIQLSAERIIRNLQKNDAENSATIKDSAQTVVEEARTIKSLVDEFSNFARMPRLALQATDIHALIRQTITLFSDIFNEVEIETQFSSDMPDKLKVDPEQLKRVFINLMDNAIDAMNKKGKILFRTSFDKAQQVLTIEISDSGPGINLRDRDKLFLPHFSTKKKGTGLGLAIVNQVIEEHNGSIDVENTKPQGAKFTIQIPA
jgi:two-component system nitrogen regulation sensor histidine kinase NtrY